jgi:hypothetical protein
MKNVLQASLRHTNDLSPQHNDVIHTTKKQVLFMRPYCLDR